MEELQGADRMVDTISVEQTANSTYSINQVLAGGFDARANLQVSGRRGEGGCAFACRFELEAPAEL